MSVKAEKSGANAQIWAWEFISANDQHLPITAQEAATYQWTLSDN